MPFKARMNGYRDQFDAKSPWCGGRREGEGEVQFEAWCNEHYTETVRSKRPLCTLQRQQLCVPSLSNTELLRKLRQGSCIQYSTLRARNRGIRYRASRCGRYGDRRGTVR